MTPSRLTRALLPERLLRHVLPVKQATAALVARPTHSQCHSLTCTPSGCRCFAQVQGSDVINRSVFFSSSPHSRRSLEQHNDHKPPDERTLQLGKTVRILHERLPTLLMSPLPSDILSPQISLHLFPSTHPHLPTVSGRIAYIAALWTAPVAWGRVPLVGNVKLTILSERMVRNGSGPSVATQNKDEKLIVKWRTCGKTEHRDGTGGVYRGVGIRTKDPVDRIKEFIAGTSTRLTAHEHTEGEEEFCGIFVFEFDERGRIVKHIIEHTEEGGHWDKTARVVSVTDWLLGQFNGRNRHQEPALALCEERPHGSTIRIVNRTHR